MLVVSCSVQWTILRMPICLTYFTLFLQSYPQFQDFIVVHDYLVTPNSRMQARIRRRGQNGTSALFPYRTSWFLSRFNRRFTVLLDRPLAPLFPASLSDSQGPKRNECVFVILNETLFCVCVAVRWDNEKKCWDLETGKIGSVINTPSLEWRLPLLLFFSISFKNFLDVLLITIQSTCCDLCGRDKSAVKLELAPVLYYVVHPVCILIVEKVGSVVREQFYSVAVTVC